MSEKQYTEQEFQEAVKKRVTEALEPPSGKATIKAAWAERHPKPKGESHDWSKDGRANIKAGFAESHKVPEQVPIVEIAETSDFYSVTSATKNVPPSGKGKMKLGFSQAHDAKPKEKTPEEQQE